MRFIKGLAVLMKTWLSTKWPEHNFKENDIFVDKVVGSAFELFAKGLNGQKL